MVHVSAVLGDTYMRPPDRVQLWIRATSAVQLAGGCPGWGCRSGEGQLLGRSLLRWLRGQGHPLI